MISYQAIDPFALSTELIVKAAKLDANLSLIHAVINDADRLFLTFVTIPSNDNKMVSVLKVLRHHVFTEITQDAVDRNIIWNKYPATSPGSCGSQDPNDTVLSYVEVDWTAESEGFFGEVLKVNIHPAHIKAANIAKSNPLRPTNSRQIAVSPSLRRLAEIWFNTEVMTIVTLPPKMGSHRSSGLLVTLEELRTCNCRHGGLDLEKILFFIDVDNNKTPQMAELGLNTSHKLDAATYVQNSRLGVAGKPRSEPPEIGIDRDKSHLPTRLFHERTTFGQWNSSNYSLDYGLDTLMTFRNNTAYFWGRVNGQGKKYRVRSAVQRHIKFLSSTWQAYSVFGDGLAIEVTL
ncbi:tol protein [Colletotrichum asianum]